MRKTIYTNVFRTRVGNEIKACIMYLKTTSEAFWG